MNTPQYGWRENLMLICMLVLALAAIFAGIRFVLNPMEGVDYPPTTEVEVDEQWHVDAPRFYPND